MDKQVNQNGFTLIELAIVLVIVSILLGYTVALFPKQQELKRYREVDRKMDEVIAAIVGFAQVNGRLPCPAIPNSAGVEDGGGNVDCNNYGGFVPVNTLGISGSLNADSLLLDPWGNPYRYYVSDSDVDGDGDSDFVNNGEMREIGLVDIFDVPNGILGSDGYIDLDGQFLICDAAGTSNDDLCTGAALVFGQPSAGPPPYAYAGAPFVLLSQGKNWGVGGAGADELENRGAILTTAFTPLIPNGPAAKAYFLKDESAGETTFVRRTTGFADDFDDVVKWVSPNILFSKMIEADQLP